MKRTFQTLAAVTLILITQAASPATPQDSFPSRTVRLIVAVAPGGGVDAMARLFADKMSAILGQPVVVVNQAGASGLIAGRQVANIEADGYNVLVASNSMIISQLMNPQPGLDTLRDLQAVASVAPQAIIIAAAPNLKIDSLKDLVTLAKSRNLNYASPGTGGAPHLLFERLSTLANARMTHIPFQSAAQALMAAMSNQTELVVVTLPPAAPFVTSNKLRGIAVSTVVRSAALPQVPTTTEAGFPTIQATVWSAFFVHAKTPIVIVSRLSDAVMQVAEMQDIKQKLGQLGFEPTSIPGEKFQNDIANELKMWAGVIEQVGLKPK